MRLAHLVFVIKHFSLIFYIEYLHIKYIVFIFAAVNETNVFNFNI